MVLRGGKPQCVECHRIVSRRYKAKLKVPSPPPPRDREWRDIPGYEGLYQVSEYGDVWSMVRRRGTRGGPRAAVKRGKYWKVDLSRDSRQIKEWRVHVLVALAFLGPMPEDCRLVRHLDDDTDNNHFTNLAYGTHSDNLKDRYRNDRRSS